MNTIDPGYVEMAAQNAKQIKSAKLFKENFNKFLEEGKNIREIYIAFKSYPGNSSCNYDEITMKTPENGWLTPFAQDILAMLDKYIAMHETEMKDTLTMAMTDEES